MALIDLDISRNWPDKSTTGEFNWDAIRVPLVEFGDRSNRNLEQIARDIFGNYELDNDGNANLTTPLIDLALMLDENVHPTGMWTFDSIANAGTVDTANIDGGSIDGTVIGGAVPSTGRFSALNSVATTRYYSLPMAAFTTGDGTHSVDRVSTSGVLQNIHATFLMRWFVAKLHLPQDAVITGLKIYYYRDDGAAIANVYIYRYSFYGTAPDTVGAVGASGGAGWSSDVGDITSGNATIDNHNYDYRVLCGIDNNDNINDAKLSMCIITYTIANTYP